MNNFTYRENFEKLSFSLFFSKDLLVEDTDSDKFI